MTDILSLHRVSYSHDTGYDNHYGTARTSGIVLAYDMIVQMLSNQTMPSEKNGGEKTKKEEKASLRNVGENTYQG